MKKLIITKLSIKDRGPFLFTGIFRDFLLVEAELTAENRESLVGNIYAARVKGVNRGINGAFLSLDNEHRGFLPTDRLIGGRFIKKISEKPIVQDEVLLVKVVKDAHQDKDAFLSAKLPQDIPEEWMSAPPGTLLYREKPYYMRRVMNDPPETYDEIVTDLEDVFKAIRTVRADVRKFEDDFSLTKIYNIESQLEKALQRKVHLKSGADLVIERTEGFVFVDVNSKKNNSGKDKDDVIFKINLEAAKELFYQLRLRNLSGMILVDFIHMDKAHKELLARELKKLSSKESVQTEFIDFTGLGIAEFTRKRLRRTLAEQIFE